MKNASSLPGPEEGPQGNPSTNLPGHQLDASKMPGHWLLARMGKRVLRPGGIEMTRKMLSALSITKEDHVVELAPGLGSTAMLALEKLPRHYTGVERDRTAAANVRERLTGSNQECVVGTASETGLDDEFADVVYGEAMLSMQTASQKASIIREAFRILKPGGRYAIHELGLTPDDLSKTTKDTIQKELSDAIHVGARPLTLAEWREVLQREGFEVEVTQREVSSMHLLEPRRVIRDEGIGGALRIAWNVLRTPKARRRIATMRNLFRRYDDHLRAVMLIAEKPTR